MGREVEWRLHTATSPAGLYPYWSTDRGREKFWAERSRSSGSTFWLCFPDGSEERCEVLRAEPPGLFEFRYFGALVSITLVDDGNGGTDLTLQSSGLSQTEFEEVSAGWLSVLLPLKARADFGVDLRNHDPARTWLQRYGDQ